MILLKYDIFQKTCFFWSYKIFIIYGLRVTSQILNYEIVGDFPNFDSKFQS